MFLILNDYFYKATVPKSSDQIGISTDKVEVLGLAASTQPAFKLSLGYKSNILVRVAENAEDVPFEVVKPSDDNF